MAPEALFNCDHKYREGSFLPISALSPKPRPFLPAWNKKWRRRKRGPNPDRRYYEVLRPVLRSRRLTLPPVSPSAGKP